ncbi:hypothetical protein [Streptacidiphilus monticola]|uniref:Uncharacterized protein n=1 Tax=Streptacidiphilus monticola TaxID=2161674 RepID=A0ABW1FV71_9ACTN
MAVLADQDASGLFQWLRELPFVESTPLGLYRPVADSALSRNRW